MALLRGVGTPPGKGAGLFWNTAHIRRLSGDGVQAVAPGQVQPGYCPDQADGIGVLGIFKGGLTASSAGICGALVFGYLASLVFKPKMK